MKGFLKILLTGLFIVVCAYILPGVYVSGLFVACLVAIVLSILNNFIKPIIVILTLPVTILTMGLFLIIINSMMILLASWLVPGFSVSGWGTAILFSFILSFMYWLFDRLLKNEK